MNAFENYYSERKSLDSDLVMLGSADFIRAMHESLRADMLGKALKHLIENWPSSEDAQNFSKYILNSSERGMGRTDSENLNKIISGGHDAFSEYTSGQQTIIDKATLFINLYSHRPGRGTKALLVRYRAVEELRSVAEAIFQIRRLA